jgi:hypothetical protein
VLYRLINFKNKTSVVCDLEDGILSESAEMMLIYFTDMYDPENIEKYVLFQKLHWLLYSRSCICTCEVKTASSTAQMEQLFLRFLLAYHFVCCVT